MSENCSPLVAPTGGRGAVVCAPVVTTTMRSNATRRRAIPHLKGKTLFKILITLPPAPQNTRAGTLPPLSAIRFRTVGQGEMMAYGGVSSRGMVYSGGV